MATSTRADRFSRHTVGIDRHGRLEGRARGITAAYVLATLGVHRGVGGHGEVELGGGRKPWQSEACARVRERARQNVDIRGLAIDYCRLVTER